MFKSHFAGFPYEHARRVPTRNLQRFSGGHPLVIEALLLVVHDGVLISRLRLRVHDRFKWCIEVLQKQLSVAFNS